MVRNKQNFPCFALLFIYQEYLITALVNDNKFNNRQQKIMTDYNINKIKRTTKTKIRVKYSFKGFKTSENGL